MWIMTVDGRRPTSEYFCLAEASQMLAAMAAENRPDNELWAHIYADDGYTWLWFLFVEGAEIITLNQRTGESDAILMFC